MNEDIEKAIGSKIAAFREQRGLKQAQLAEILDVAPETISRMERGTSIPSIKTLSRIGQALNVEIKDFFSEVTSVPKGRGKKDQELAKITVLLQNRNIEDIRLSYRMLKSLVEGLEKSFKPVKK